MGARSSPRTRVRVTSGRQRLCPHLVMGSHLSGNLTCGKSGSATVRKATMESAEAPGVVEFSEVPGVAEFSEVPGMKKRMEVTMHVEEERRSDRNADWRVP